MLADTVWNMVQTILKAKLQKKYPKLTVTNASMNDTPTGLPNLFVNQIDAAQTGMDTEKDRENAIISVIQLEASSNEGLTEARNIINDAGNILIEKHYSVISGPTQSNTSVYRMIMRLRRTIGNEETF